MSEEIKNEETIKEDAAETCEGESVEPSIEERYKELEDKYLRAHADFENVKKGSKKRSKWQSTIQTKSLQKICCLS